VAEGIYRPDQGVGITPGDQTVSLRIKTGWKVKGGYAGNGHPDPDERDVALYETTLSGDLLGNDITDVDDPCDLLTHLTRTDNSYHVVVTTDCGYTTLIDGFTIKAGNANGPALANQSGGGLYEGKPTINNCRIVKNAAYYLGGGIKIRYGYSDEGSSITNSIIANNVAGAGGGIYGCIRMEKCIINANSAIRYGAGGIYLPQGCDTYITDCVISNNSSLTNAGGVQLGISDSQPIFTRCLFIANTAGGNGGALAIDGCTCEAYPEFYQCRIIANSAGSDGGGIYTYGYSYTQLHSCLLLGNSAGGSGGAIRDGNGYDDGGSLIVNCTFAHNTAASEGGAIRYAGYTRRARKLTNSILWYNSDGSGQTGHCSQICIDTDYPPSVNYCCIQVLPGGGGSGNTEANPLFADPDGADNLAGNEDDDLHLLLGSICIDAGTNGPVNHDTDLDGNARIINGRVNMGAYELPFPPPILPGHVYRYFKGTQEPPANWNRLAFDDSTWLHGPTGIGYGDGDDATVLDDMRYNYASVYARRLFYLPQPAIVTSLVLTMDYDDAFVAYLNGVEVARNNIAGSPPAHNTLAESQHEASGGNINPNPPEKYDISAVINHLAAGMNVLAVQGHNVSLTSSDFSLIPSLSLNVTIYVDDNAPNDPAPGDPTVSDPLEDGTLKHPFDAIQEAISVATYDSTVIVLEGTYTGTGNRDIDFQAKAITLRSKNGPETCIINPQGTETQPHRGFYFHGKETADSILDGFTITNGHADSGGAIYCGGTSSPTLKNCIFTRNSAEREGGGLYNLRGNPVVTNCIFTKNSAAQDGGGMQNDDGSPTIIACTFIRNIAADEGGGLCNEDTHPPAQGPILANCIFIGNSAIFGGGVENDISSPTISNCTFSGNSAHQGAAIYNEHSAAPTITDCILWADTPEEIYNDASTATVSYSDIQGGWPGQSNMELNPYFARPGYWDANGTPDDPRDDFGDDGDYHLKSQAGRWDKTAQNWVRDTITSPCIDAGNPMNPIGLEPFPNGGLINMGAFGGTTEASKSYFGRPPCETVLAGDLNGDCRVDFKDVRLMTLHWLENNKP
jgi:predicted outer membrane repeat protein